MYKVFLTLGFFILGSLIVQSQSNKSALNLSEKKENDLIGEIKNEFISINKNISNYQKTVKDLDGYSTDGGDMRIFKAGNEVKKVETQYYGETGKAFIEYYFKNGDIFFIFRVDSRYNSPYYITESDSSNDIEAFDRSKTQVFENRYYFSSNKLIQWINSDKKKVNKTNKEFSEKELELIEDINFIKEKIK